jgi:hypothetical protein
MRNQRREVNVHKPKNRSAVRKLSYEKTSGTKTQFTDSEDLALAYRVVSGMESLPESPGGVGKLLMEPINILDRRFNYQVQLYRLE